LTVKVTAMNVLGFDFIIGITKRSLLIRRQSLVMVNRVNLCTKSLCSSGKFLNSKAMSRYTLCEKYEDISYPSPGPHQRIHSDKSYSSVFICL